MTKMTGRKQVSASSCSGMKQWIPAVLTWSLLGCQAAPPEPPPEPDHLVADIAKLGSDLLACEQRENVLLHEKKDDLDAKIAAAKAEALELLARAPQRKSTVQP
jgi:hypothetical protein